MALKNGWAVAAVRWVDQWAGESGLSIVQDSFEQVVRVLCVGSRGGRVTPQPPSRLLFCTRLVTLFEATDRHILPWLFPSLLFVAGSLQSHYSFLLSYPLWVLVSACIFSNYGFLWIYAQEWDYWLIMFISGSLLFFAFVFFSFLPHKQHIPRPGKKPVLHSSNQSHSILVSILSEL